MAKDAAPKRPSAVPGEDKELTTPELNRALAHAAAAATFRKAGHEELARSQAAKVFASPRMSTNTVAVEIICEAMDIPLGSV